jgi:hypothetical protein
MRDVPFAGFDVDDVPAFLLETDPGGAPTPKPEPRVVLPPSGTGVRAHRRRQRRRHTWKRGARLGAPALGLVALVLLLALHPWHHGGAGPDGTPAPAGRQAPPASSALLVQQGAEGEAVSITVLVANPTGDGGHVVLVPPATMSELPSFGLDGVGRALALGGPSLLQVTLENLLGVRLPPALVVKDAQLAAFARPAGALDVDVPARVEETDARGAVSVLWDVGPLSLSPADVPRFLSVRGQGNDLTRLARHQAFWTALLARIAHDPAAASGLPPDLARAVRPLAAGTVSYETLPVQAVDAGTGGQEVYKVRQADLDQLVHQLLPGVSSGPRVRVQVLNGTGVIGSAQRVAQRLVPAGARVVLSGNADSFAYAQTQIVFYDRSQQQAATRVRDALGTGRLVLSRQPLDVVDVTVVVGKDFNG